MAGKNISIHFSSVYNLFFIGDKAIMSYITLLFVNGSS